MIVDPPSHHLAISILVLISIRDCLPRVSSNLTVACIKISEGEEHEMTSVCVCMAITAIQPQ